MIEPDLRDRILATPEILLEDREVMNALAAANDRTMGDNIIDMRGIAMQRLETRLDRLEDTHRSVIAAAYDNLSGTNQIHRAILQLLGSPDFETFLDTLAGDVAATLRVDHVRLVMESQGESFPPTPQQSDEILRVVEPGHIAGYLNGGRNLSLRQVTMRPLPLPSGAPADESIYGEHAANIRSEALLLLDFGEGSLPGLLAFGAARPQRFLANHGSDLLSFLAEAFERMMLRWLA